MKDNVYRIPAKSDPEPKPDLYQAERVWEALNATLASVKLSPMSHYQDHVVCRWKINLERALGGSRDFIWAKESWGERYDLQTIGWWKFFWRTRKMPWAKRFRWIAERLDRGAA